jgi:8-oxo-dGTP pyrophosphatase MutT (NUDIX family)
MTKTNKIEEYALSVYAVIENEGRILLTEDAYRPGWKLPGGGVMASERILDALRREVREEVGLEIRPGRLLLMTNWLKKGTSLGRTRIYFLADGLPGEIDIRSGEVAKARWFSGPELLDLREEAFLHPRHYHEAVRHYLANALPAFREL